MNSPEAERCANVSWSFGALLIAGIFLIKVHKSGYNVVQTVGYLWANLGLIFVLLIGLGFVLTGVVALANVLYGGTHPEPRMIRFISSMAVLTLVAVAAMGFAWWHPLGYLWSIIVAVFIYIVGVIAMRRLARGLREEDMIALQDKLMKATDDPNEPARWVP